MTTASAAFGVSDLALEKAQRADLRLAHKRNPNPIIHLIAKVFTGWATVWMRARAKALADTAVWFKGAKAKLAEELEDGQLHAPEKLVEALEKAEADILRLREPMLDILRKRELRGDQDEFTSAIRAWIYAATDLHDAMADFRWAALEADADADLKAGRAKTFDSLEDLLAELKS